jgi:hypothetical protein
MTSGLLQRPDIAPYQRPVRKVPISDIRRPSIFAEMGQTLRKRLVRAVVGINYTLAATAQHPTPSAGRRAVCPRVLLEKPFAPAQVVTAVSQLLNTSTPTSQATN